MKYILDFADHMTDEEVTQYATTHDITLIKQFNQFGQVYLGSCVSAPITNDQLVSCVSDETDPIDLLSFHVDLVEHSAFTTINIEDDKNWWKVASISNIDFDQENYSHSLRGKSCTVYIMDSGIKVDHPEFVGASVELLHSFTDDFVDTNGHGTAIASVISGKECGLTNAKLKVVKIFDSAVATYQSDLLAALNAILVDYEATMHSPSIVNISWSIPYNTYINDKIQILINRGMFVVCSAGNSGISIADVTPACIPDVITVGSYNQELVPSNFSNYTGDSFISYTHNETNHGALDGWAPGEQIWAADLSGSYGYTAGTSMSAAIASAAAAYNLSLYVDVAVDDLEAMYETVLGTDSMIEAIKRRVFKRTGILETSGVYENSVDGIATLVVVIPEISSTRPSVFLGHAGTKYMRLFADPCRYSSVSSEFLLPNFVNISDTGHIVIQHELIADPYLLIPEIVLSVTDREGNVIENIINIIIFEQNADIIEITEQVMSSEDENDPLLQILLENTCNPNQCGGLCNSFTGECVDFSKTDCPCVGF